jgi:uncharacterized membrane protein
MSDDSNSAVAADDASRRRGDIARSLTAIGLGLILSACMAGLIALDKRSSLGEHAVFLICFFFVSSAIFHFLIHYNRMAGKRVPDPVA